MKKSLVDYSFTILGERAMKNNPEIKKQLEIEQNDERNIAMANAAKAKAYEMMIYLFGSLIFSFGLMGLFYNIKNV